MENIEQQNTVALNLAQQRLSKNSSNNPVCLVKVEDLDNNTQKKVYRLFVALRKPVIDTSCVSFQGFEIPATQRKKFIKDELKTRESAAEYAEKNEVEFFDLIFPWHRVVSLENLSYQTNANKGK
jgi:hypothetical protein